MPVNPFRVTLTAPTSTAGFPVYAVEIDMEPSINMGISVVSSVSYVVEHTLDYTGSSTFISSNATWFLVSSSSGITANNFTTFTSPTTMIRLNSTAAGTTAPVTMTIIQAG